VPSVLAVMMRTLMLSSAHNRNLLKERVDLYLTPPIEEFGLFDWDHLEQIVDTGYQYARKKIEEWQAGQMNEDVAPAREPQPAL
jgi:lysophospholipid hydrolase